MTIKKSDEQNEEMMKETQTAVENNDNNVIAGEESQAETGGATKIRKRTVRSRSSKENSFDHEEIDNDDDSAQKSGSRNQRGAKSRKNDSNNSNYDAPTAQVAGIVDFQEGFAFLRTTGYLPDASDAYISQSVIREYKLRPGDAVVGEIRDVLSVESDDQSQNSSQNNNRFKKRTPKFNPLQSVTSINGLSVEESLKRAKFTDLTPLYPEHRLMMEIPQGTMVTDAQKELGGLQKPTERMTSRIIDLVAPIGKGQRGLIVAPPKAGKTITMQQIARSIAANNPEVHLMVVLVDERPEEVTDMERTVRGEVISSTFDRPPVEHTMVAELAIERAKRLVEQGKDVVILLDSITRLARAYNFVAPVSGRVLSGGVDAAALYPPKKFLGAARNIEDGGSLTIIASALVETGSKMDEVIFEEFKGTGNMELKLSRELADSRIFPAIDVSASGTRREEWLIPEEELKVIYSLHRALAQLDKQQATETLIAKLKDSTTNIEFLLKLKQNMAAQGAGKPIE